MYPSRPLNEVVQEMKAKGSTFASVNELSKKWSEEADLKRFPEVRCPCWFDLSWRLKETSLNGLGR